MGPQPAVRRGDGTSGAMVDPGQAMAVRVALLPKRAAGRSFADWLAHQDVVEEWHAVKAWTARL